MNLGNHTPEVRSELVDGVVDELASRDLQSKATWDDGELETQLSDAIWAVCDTYIDKHSRPACNCNDCDDDTCVKQPETVYRKVFVITDKDTGQKLATLPLTIGIGATVEGYKEAGYNVSWGWK